jgi:hypothetical protein
MIKEGGNVHGILPAVNSEGMSFIRDISDDEDDSYFDKSLRSSKTKQSNPSPAPLSNSPITSQSMDLRCAVCHTRTSHNWCKVPVLLRMYYWNLTGEKVKSKCLCEDCGANWLKYGVCTNPKEDGAKRDVGNIDLHFHSSCSSFDPKIQLREKSNALGVLNQSQRNRQRRANVMAVQHPKR